MIEMEDHTNDLSEGRIPFLDYKTYTDRVFFLTSKDGANDVMITGRLEIPQARRTIVMQALNQFSNLLNSKTFLINVIMPDLSTWMWNACGLSLGEGLIFYMLVWSRLFLSLIEFNLFKNFQRFKLARYNIWNVRGSHI